MDDLKYLQEAIVKSKESIGVGGYPVGAVVVKAGQIIGMGLSNGKQLYDPTSHAEVAAIREVCLKLSSRDLKNTVLYSSLEPCLMCFAAASWAGIPRIVYACRRTQVVKQHYEGNHDLATVNKTMRHPIELVHVAELENEALQVIKNWEQAEN